jgi:hypothetical protein
VPLLLTQPILLAFLLPPPDSLFLPMCCPLLFPPLRGAGGHPGSRRRWIRPRGINSHPLLIAPVRTTPMHRKRPKGKGKPTHRRGVDKRDERPKVVAIDLHGPKVDGAPHHRRRVLLRKTLVQQPRARQHRRVGPLVISKMRSSLSIRGTIHR